MHFSKTRWKKTQKSLETRLNEIERLNRHFENTKNYEMAQFEEFEKCKIFVRGVPLLTEKVWSPFFTKLKSTMYTSDYQSSFF